MADSEAVLNHRYARRNSHDRLTLYQQLRCGRLPPGSLRIRFAFDRASTIVLDGHDRWPIPSNCSTPVLVPLRYPNYRTSRTESVKVDWSKVSPSTRELTDFAMHTTGGPRWATARFKTEQACGLNRQPRDQIPGLWLVELEIGPRPLSNPKGKCQ